MIYRKLFTGLLLLTVLAGAGLALYSASPVARALPRLPELPLIKNAVQTGDKPDPQRLKLLAQAKPGRAFVLSRQHSLQFPVQSGELRLLSTASVQDIEAIRQARLRNPEQRWAYALALEFVNGAGEVLQQRTLHIQANLQEVKRADGSVGASLFFLDQERHPLASVSNTLSVPDLPDLAGVRVRLAEHDPALSEVILRVYQARAESSLDLGHRWQRLSPRQQDELARGSVHHKALLDDAQKQNLLRNARQAIGPLGQEGKDYQVRDIYLLAENEGELQALPIMPFGNPFSAQQYASLPIPAQGGKLRLEFSASPRPGEEVSGDLVHWEWRGPSLFQRQQGNISWPRHAASAGHSMQVAGGLLELRATRAGVVRAWLQKEGGDEIEITPAPQWQRVYLSRGPHTPLSFSLAASEHATALRLSLRSEQSGALQESRAAYEIHDSQGKRLAGGELQLNAQTEHYASIPADYLARQEQRSLSQLQEFYFLLPQGATGIKIYAMHERAPILLAVHSRPFALVREMKIPDDYYSFAPSFDPSFDTAHTVAPAKEQAAARIPAWFALQPDQYQSLIAADRSRNLLLQSRPPETTPEQIQIMSGRYAWQDLRPLGQWLARPLYSARDPHLPFRAEMLPTSFSPLPAGREVKLDFPVFQGKQILTPTLVYVGHASTTLNLEVDGQPYFSTTLHGPYAEQELPPLPAGKHRLRLQSKNGGRFYLNHVPATGETLLRRIAQKFDGKLEFEYQRQHLQNETLSLHLYQAPAARGQMALEVSISGPQPPAGKALSDWLFQSRLAHLSPAAGKPSLVFDTSGELSDSGQVLYLPFPADAPRGKYRISIKAPQAARTPAYLSLTRLSARLEAHTEYHYQPELSHVHISE